MNVVSNTPAAFGRRSAFQSSPSPAPAAFAAPERKTAATPPPTGAAELRAACLARIDPSALANATPDQLYGDIERLIAEIADEQRIQINGREQRQLANELVHDMVGLGPLEPLLEDDSITDIMVNGPDKIFAERHGKLLLTSARFRDVGHVANVAQRIAAAIGRRVDESSPMVDARLADGSRVNIIFPPLALNGACISIRKFARRRINFDTIVANGSATTQMAKVLRLASAARLNIIISGGTGAGKTTLMNALSQTI
ncbi:MAG TPA: ATPase, T2SS/T4P/T4SS family, partial [Acetobacteraceae bacterium]|nr:ATPase, T2SS/T4P/T4SS family [Acetobacteraceae bacterium]